MTCWACGLIAGLGTPIFAAPIFAHAEETAEAVQAALWERAASFPSVHYTVRVTSTIPPGPETLLREGDVPKEMASVEAWSKGLYRRQETTVPPGVHMVTIHRPEGDYNYDPAQQTYERTDTDPDQAEAPWVTCRTIKRSDSVKVLRHETVDGVEITVLEQTLNSGAVVSRAWVRNDTGFTTRSETVVSLGGSNVLMIAECGDVSFADLPDSLFSVQAGGTSLPPKAR